MLWGRDLKWPMMDIKCVPEMHFCVVSFWLQHNRTHHDWHKAKTVSQMGEDMHPEVMRANMHSWELCAAGEWPCHPYQPMECLCQYHTWNHEWCQKVVINLNHEKIIRTSHLHRKQRKQRSWGTHCVSIQRKLCTSHCLFQLEGIWQTDIPQTPLLELSLFLFLLLT